MEQQLKEQTINGLRSFYNDGISNIIVCYLIMTPEQFLNNCREQLGVTPDIWMSINTYDSGNAYGRCVKCDKHTNRLLVYQNKVIYPLNYSDLCESCSPHFLCSHSKHLEDFKRKCSANKCSYCNKKICHDIIDYKTLEVYFEHNEFCEKCYKSPYKNLCYKLKWKLKVFYNKGWDMLFDR